MQALAMRINIFTELELTNIKTTGIVTGYKGLIDGLKTEGIDVVVNAKENYDILHIHSFGPLSLLKAMHEKKPVVITTHTVPDEMSLLYRGGKYIQGLFEKYLTFMYNQADLLIYPSEFGIQCRTASTACWRGYVMKYMITDGKLILDGFWFRPNSEDLPKINEVEPVEVTKETDPGMGYFFSHAYKNLNLKLPFNGSLWVAKDFIDSQYVHMGFQRPMAFRTVLESSSLLMY